MAAASELFLQGGVNSLSVRAIAATAGLSTIGIYSHFKGKQGVLDTLYIEGFNLVFDSMDIEVEGRVEVAHILLACKGYLDVATQHEAHYRLIFGESGSDHKPSEQAKESSERAFSKLVSNMGEYLHSSDIDADGFELAMDIWAILHGYVSISLHARADANWDWKSMALRAVELHLSALNQESKSG